MINLVLWLVMGGAIGWLAGRVLGTNGERWVTFNVAVGMAGAFVGGMLFGGATLSGSRFSEGALLISFLGAVISSALLNFFRRSVVHQ